MEHKTSGGYGPHAWDCAPCKEAADERRARDERENPHRPGTKAHAKWDAMASSSRMGCDPRTETYWSM